MTVEPWRRWPAVTLVGVPMLLLALTSVPIAASPQPLPDFALSLALVAPLLLRRRWPTPVFALMALIAFAQWWVRAPLVADAALLVAFYNVVIVRPWREVIACASVLELGVVMAAARWAPPEGRLLTVVLLTGMAVAAGGLGLNSRTRRAYLDGLRDRAERLELERDQQAMIAASAERARIAREMHDIVAHHLAVMTTLADGGLAALPSRPARSAEALQAISATGRTAMADMRGILGILDADPRPAAPPRPQPGLTQISDLARQVSDAGVEVNLVLQPPDLAPTAVSAGVQLTAYRVVQEALTNVLKHAGPGTNADVAVTVDADAVHLDVQDDGAAASNDEHVVRQPGRGLAGMRERVTALGGTFTAAASPGGGWHVNVVLPHETSRQ